MANQLMTESIIAVIIDWLNITNCQNLKKLLHLVLLTLFFFWSENTT